MTIDFPELEAQLRDVSSIVPPFKRAAYSDRTAWLMACLCELAYQKFEGDGQSILNLAQEIAALTNTTKIAEILKEARQILNRENTPSSEKLSAVLACAEFTLVGEPITIPETDTQCFVATRNPDGKTLPAIGVLVFRGTTNLRDWVTNIRATQTELTRTVDGRRQILGRLHTGFNEAYLSAHDEINARLKDLPGDMPIYITGHSLGGALATVATWYQKSHRLAACYTFGAPRVGTPSLRKYFRTPIYRVVNVMDPVPNVPPAGWFMSSLKVVLRGLSRVIPGGFIMDKLVNTVINMQKYRHYGDSRYLTDAAPGSDGLYPGLNVLPTMGPIGRLARYIGALRKGKTTQRANIVAYHDIWRYRDKLRAFAKVNAPTEHIPDRDGDANQA